jgi:hypothetical protein
MQKLTKMQETAFFLFKTVDSYTPWWYIHYIERIPLGGMVHNGKKKSY